MFQMIRFGNSIEQFYEKLRTPLDFLPSLLLRIYLAPIFIYAGYGKLQLSNSDAGFPQRLLADPYVAGWFGDGLGLPFPELMAFLAGWTEFLGGWLLLFGLMTRYIAIPLMVTMVVAAVTVHWENGWHTLPETKLQVPWEWKKDEIAQAVERRSEINELVKQHGDYQHLTQHGKVTILRSGIEAAATYFLMLLVLVMTGGGRHVSMDYWFAKRCRRAEE